MDHDKDHRMNKRRGRPPANTLRYAVMLTLDWDDDRHIIDMLLGLPHGKRSPFLKKALRFYMENGEVAPPQGDLEK